MGAMEKERTTETFIDVLTEEDLKASLRKELAESSSAPQSGRGKN